MMRFRRIRSVRFGLLAAAIAAFALFGGIAHLVGRAPDPNPLMTWEASFVNHSTLVAWWLTWFGYAYSLVPVCVVLLVIAWRVRAWRWRAPFAIVSLLLSWQGADFFQHLFARPRRLDWVVKHETAFSFPSSHAAIAVGFYLLLAVFAWQSPWRYGRLAGGLLALLSGGIIWSRLALGAHYATDLLGGSLWAVTVVAALAAVAPTKVFEGRPAASLEYLLKWHT